MKLVISKKKINIFLLLLILIWYVVPIVQERGGMLAIGVLIFLWLLTCDLNKVIRAAPRLFPYLTMLFVLSMWLLWGVKYYGGIETLYFVCSTFLMFFPTILFWYYYKNIELSQINWIAFVFWGGLLFGAINTYVVLEEYPIASRLMATSSGDIYSKMGAGGYGFAYSLMIAFPFLMEVRRTSKSRILKLIYLAIMLFFVATIIKCEYTTCLLLLFVGVALHLMLRTNMVLGIIALSFLPVLFVFEDGVGNLFLYLADVFKETEVIAVRLRDVATGFLNSDMSTMESSRYSLYMESLNGFLQYPVLGSGLHGTIISGGHSTILDTLAIYGIGGFLAVLYSLTGSFKKIIKSVDGRSKSIYLAVIIVFWLLTALNPTIYIYQLGIVIFLVGPLSVCAKDGGKD